MSDARNTLRLWNPIQEHKRIKTTFDVCTSYLSSTCSGEGIYCLIPYLVLQLYKSFSSKQTSETALVTDFVPFFLLRSLDQESNNFLAPVLSKDGVVVYASATASSAFVHAQCAVWSSRLLLKIISAAKIRLGSPEVSRVNNVLQSWVKRWSKLHILSLFFTQNGDCQFFLGRIEKNHCLLPRLTDLYKATPEGKAAKTWSFKEPVFIQIYMNRLPGVAGDQKTIEFCAKIAHQRHKLQEIVKIEKKVKKPLFS
jgi:hypothetical protein